MKNVLLRNHAAIVHLNIDEVGVNAIHGRAEGFK
jgi:hypothetical protein